MKTDEAIFNLLNNIDILIDGEFELVKLNFLSEGARTNILDVQKFRK